LNGIMPEDGEISANCVLCDQFEQNNIMWTNYRNCLSDYLKLSNQIYILKDRDITTL